MEINIGNRSYKLISADDPTFKLCFEADYKNDAQKKEHVHRKIYLFSGETEDINGITYPVLNMSTLSAHPYVKLVDFLWRRFQLAGVRPDTPFHANDENRYQPLGMDPYRYMEFNTIGGGMRLVFDSTSNDIFLSAHYSDPAVLRAAAGSVDRTNLDNLVTVFSRTHVRVKRHSDGSIARAFRKVAPENLEALRDQAALQAAQSPAFIEWLKNKNSGQDRAHVQRLYKIPI